MRSHSISLFRNHRATKFAVKNNKPSISKSFCSIRIWSLLEATKYVHQLPYGRTKDRTDVQQILTYGRGTCSSKHALLSVLAEELSISVKLILGIFLFTKENKLPLSPILHEYKIDAIRETHCYLSYKDTHNLDIPFLHITSFVHSPRALQETVISYHQAGKYKVEYHQAFIYSWLKNNHLQFDRIWNARETWIKHLSSCGSFEI
ncbi:Uncharacterized protein PHSC3_000971 [Chlamydiales bacterium STE3]|nr:Uncharacterized protein PHSC3_000971 [Chlamydiales bacterium STE3]